MVLAAVAAVSGRAETFLNLDVGETGIGEGSCGEGYKAQCLVHVSSDFFNVYVLGVFIAC